VRRRGRGRRPGAHAPRGSAGAPKSDGRGEAHRVALCGSKAPEGQARWTLKLLADALTSRGRVIEISCAAVRHALKNQLQPWRKQSWCLPEKAATRFVAPREDVLDRSAAAPPEEEPRIARDEASQHLLADVPEPLDPAPGPPAREDSPSERNGVPALFLFVDPIRGGRRVSCRDRRPRVAWAPEVRRRWDEDDPPARTGKLVCDHLNTPTSAALSEAFPAAEAHRLAHRRRSTPRRATAVGCMGRRSSGAS
jgi:hypothetical protein